VRAFSYKSQLLIISGALLLAGGLLGFLNLSLGTQKKSELLFGTLVLVGLGLRLAYWLNTPLWLRAYDWDSHLEYISFLSQFKALPLPEWGWQFYQMPLYYLLSSWGFLLAGKFFEASDLISYLEIQSLVISLLSFSLCLAISSSCNLILKCKLLLLLLFATSPALIRLSSQVTNDTMVCFFSLLFTYTVVSRTKPLSYSLTVCLAALSKLSGLVLLPALLVALRSRISYTSLAILLAVAAFPAALLNFYRNSTEIIGRYTAQALSPHLRVESISWIPKPLSWQGGGAQLDSPIGYYLKTYIYGEFPSALPNTLQAVLILSTLLLAIILSTRVLLSRRDRETYVGKVMIISAVLSLGFLFWQHPFRPCLDFRHTLPAIGFAYIILASSPSKRLLGSAHNTLIVLHSICGAALILSWSYFS